MADSNYDIVSELMKKSAQRIAEMGKGPTDPWKYRLVVPPGYKVNIGDIMVSTPGGVKPAAKPKPPPDYFSYYEYPEEYVGDFSCFGDGTVSLPSENAPPKCECGWSITLGRDDHPSFHAADCPIKVAYVKKEGNP